MKPLLTAKKIKDEGNAWGYKVIEILMFNYDGKGGALVRNDGELGSYVLSDVHGILFGGDDGEKCYEVT
jgi:hypothetical protein